MSITIHQIAEASNTSIATVSKVLNNREGVSEQVRLKVLQTADRLGYFPYIKARESGLFRDKAKFIAQVLGHVHPMLMNKLKTGISFGINNSSYYDVSHFLNSTEEKNINKVKLFINNLQRDNDIAGLLIAFIRLDEKIIHELISSNLYTVLINTKNEHLPNINIDNVRSAYIAAEYLIRTGCKKIGLIIPHEPYIDVWQERVIGYKKALQDHKIEFQQHYIEYENTFEVNQIKLATKSLLDKNPDMDGILFSSDWQAYAGMNYLREINVKIPEQISIIGFDNLEFDDFIQPTLTSINQPIEEMGRLSINLLLEMIKEKKMISKNVLLESNLIVRNSTRKI